MFKINPISLPAKDENILQLSKLIQANKCLVVLTGAGTSKESGVPTFRGEDGLWQQYQAEELDISEIFPNKSFVKESTESTPSELAPMPVAVNTGIVVVAFVMILVVATLT